jgi:hypothetical protein
MKGLFSLWMRPGASKGGWRATSVVPVDANDDAFDVEFISQFEGADQKRHVNYRNRLSVDPTAYPAFVKPVRPGTAAMQTLVGDSPSILFDPCMVSLGSPAEEMRR